ncbi:DUF5017 domain-containing protein, partial [Pontibacter qinzhouensis]
MLIALTLLSCDKTMEVVAPDFDVQAEKLTYKVGEPVKFNFT